MTIECSRPRSNGGGRLHATAVALWLLAIAPAAAAAEGARLDLFHGPDEAGTMTLAKLRMVLDGKELDVPLPATDADPERPLLSRTVEPGVHKLEVEASLENGGSVFSYMEGYRIKMRGLLEVEVLDGKGVAIRSRILPRGGITTPWAERKKLVLTLSAAEGQAAPPVVVAAAAPAQAARAAPISAEPAAAQPAAIPAEPPPAGDAERAPASPPAAEVAAAEPAPVQRAAIAAPERTGDEEPAVAAAPVPPAKPAHATRVAMAAPPGAPASADAPRAAAPSPAPAAAARAPAPSPALAAAPRVPSANAAPRPSPERAAAPAGACTIPTVRFEFDNVSLTARAQEDLDRFAACVASSRLGVRVEGHSDSRGTEEYNRWLAWDRAASVAAYLREHGLADRRITTRSEGASRPLCADATDECFARNRRVDVMTVE